MSSTSTAAALGTAVTAPKPSFPFDTPADATTHALAHGGKVTNLLTTTQISAPAAGACAWHHATGIGLTDEVKSVLAWLIADAVMESRSGASNASALWHQAAVAGKKLTGADRDIVAAFVVGVFGLPGSNMSEQHLIGHVAEWLWYLHATEVTDPSRTLLLLEPPKFNVTEPGADGFVVYSSTPAGTPQAPGATTFYRLWEIKKYTGTNSVTSSVGVAYEQLTAKAARYLAQLTSYHSGTPGDIGDLCKQLVDFWVNANDRAGVGVTVASSKVPGPTTCFSTMGAHFPQFANPGQLEGLIVTIDSLVDIARCVREYLWIVL